jgi:hypothetical protein
MKDLESGTDVRIIGMYFYAVSAPSPLESPDNYREERGFSKADII